MKRAIFDLFLIFREELRSIFSDSTVMVLFFVGTLVYPLLYSWIYNNEMLHDTPVAVVDLSHSAQSRDYIRRLDASPDVAVAYRCASMAEARQFLEARKAHGIVLIPAAFGDDLALGRQTTVSAYADMSSFLYYKSLFMAVNFTGQDMGGEIQVKRLMGAGYTSEQALTMADPVPATFTPLYNTGGGYAGFLIPAVLVLVIHQTLLVGICILAAINREKNGFRLLVPMSERYHGTVRIVGGKALAYFSIYFMLVFYVLFLVPRMFGLPHAGNPLSGYLFLVPFLFAAIFFAMMISVCFRERELPMLLLLFLSVPLLFLSGVAWPLESMPAFWRWLAYLIPCTHGVQGFIKINSMGATLSQVRPEYFALCLQMMVYLIATFLAYRYQIIRAQRAMAKENGILDTGIS
ncbi:MAG: ABC transporter permease [Bacteroidales bacterium]|nr:ABC transporter permease [Bacteroidales bacterium]